MKYDGNGALIQSDIDEFPLVNRGKVRDVYDLGDVLLFIATDRISAFDVVMPNGIPKKGSVLTQMSLFWFDRMAWIPNHLISADLDDYPDSLRKHAEDLAGRSFLVKKANPIPVECVVRGYITGGGWKEYQNDGKVSGIVLRDGYRQSEKLDEPIFTPSTKAERGEHDESVSFAEVESKVGGEVAGTIRDLSLEIYQKAADYAATRGIILADTKFEFGEVDGEIILIDEVLTPDSSRFWPKEQYQVGGSPPSLDKQFVRDYLEGLDWGKTPPAPELPKEIVEKTSAKYLEAYETLTGRALP